MGLVIIGIGESSKVAIIIFVFHLLSLTLLCTFCFVYFAQNGFDTLFSNFKTPVEGSIFSALFLGFSAAMLGISGFESSANYVEEQKEGVFPKTLRNMWVVFFMLYRTYIFKGFLDILGYVFPDKGHLFKTLNLYTKKLLAVINRQQFVFFYQS